MGFMDQLKRIARPYAEDEEDEYEDTPLAASPDPQPVRQQASAPRYKFDLDDEPTAEPVKEKREKVVSIPNVNQMQIVLKSSITCENAYEIADHLSQKHIIILNMESTEKDVARRIIDYLSGVTYALNGKLRKVAISTFLLIPSNVEFNGELMEELGNNGIYFE